MGLFKGISDKPYTKADYYREMEERAAAKRAAQAAAVVVVPVKEPDWLEPDPIPSVPMEVSAEMEPGAVVVVEQINEEKEKPIEQTFEEEAKVVQAEAVKKKSSKSKKKKEETI